MCREIIGDGKLFRFPKHLYFVMKNNFLLFTLAFFALFIFGSSVSAQKQLEQKVVPNPLEIDSLHDLDVARQSFKARKAYKAVLLRTEVIMAANPEFSKMDEVLYLSAMSSYYLSEGRGKQKIDQTASDADKKKYAPEKLRADAAAYLKQLTTQFPNSEYKEEAEKTLKLIEAKK